MTDTTDKYLEASNLLAQNEEDNREKLINEGIQELFKEAFDNFLKEATMFSKLTYLLNTTTQDINAGTEIDWELIYGYLRKYPKYGDFNIFGRPESFKDLYQIYENLHVASLGLQPWQEHKCKSCGKKFFLNYGEVNFYINKKMSLPKRCKSCRSHS